MCAWICLFYWIICRGYWLHDSELAPQSRHYECWLYYRIIVNKPPVCLWDYQDWHKNSDGSELFFHWRFQIENQTILAKLCPFMCILLDFFTKMAVSLRKKWSDFFSSKTNVGKPGTSSTIPQKHIVRLLDQITLLTTIQYIGFCWTEVPTLSWLLGVRYLTWNIITLFT